MQHVIDIVVLSHAGAWVGKLAGVSRGINETLRRLEHWKNVALCDRIDSLLSNHIGFKELYTDGAMEIVYGGVCKTPEYQSLTRIVINRRNKRVTALLMIWRPQPGGGWFKCGNVFTIESYIHDKQIPGLFACLYKICDSALIWHTINKIAR